MPGKVGPGQGLIGGGKVKTPVLTDTYIWGLKALTMKIIPVHF